MRYLAAGPLIAALLAALAVAISPARAQGIDLAPGQVWTLRDEKASPVRVVVVRIEPFGTGTAVRVSLLDVPIPAGLPGAGGLTRIGHMPFTTDALMASLGRLVATDGVPAATFDAGYRDWQANQGGVFTITVDAAIVVAFGTIRGGT